MTQRKLTYEELKSVMEARWHLRKVVGFIGHPVYSGVVLSGLDEVATHGTTDGKPWIEPQPEIGDGYRVATPADKERRDRQGFFEGEWVQAAMGICFCGVTYRVPVDRIPTDEDAVGRPTVMVSTNLSDEWLARPLLAVTAMGFLVASGDGFTNWKQARFPYPGELD